MVSRSASGGTPRKPVFTTIFKNERNGVGQIFSGFRFGSALAIGAGDFRAISDIPLAIPLDYRSKFVSHRTPRLVSG